MSLVYVKWPIYNMELSVCSNNLIWRVKSRANNLFRDKMSNTTNYGRLVVQEDVLQRRNHHNVTNRDVVLEQLKTFLLHQFKGSKSYMISGRDFQLSGVKSLAWFQLSYEQYRYYWSNIGEVLCIDGCRENWSHFFETVHHSKSLFREWVDFFLFVSDYNFDCCVSTFTSPDLLADTALDHGPVHDGPVYEL